MRAGRREMYVARHRQFVVKRMPDSGSVAPSGCPSYEPEVQQSGLGELVGEAVLESEPGRVELRVDFPWTRVIGRGVPRGEPQEVAEIGVPRRQMTLRALMHFLFERAGFKPLEPGDGEQTQPGRAAQVPAGGGRGDHGQGVPLAERLYVPEPFSENSKADAAQRGARNWPCCAQDGQTPLAIVIGEFKASEATSQGCQVWIRHMPDAPLLIAGQVGSGSSGCSLRCSRRAMPIPATRSAWSWPR